MAPGGGGYLATACGSDGPIPPDVTAGYALAVSMLAVLGACYRGGSGLGAGAYWKSYADTIVSDQGAGATNSNPWAIYVSKTQLPSTKKRNCTSPELVDRSIRVQ